MITCKLMLKVLVPLVLIVMMVSTVYAAPPTQLWSDAVGTNDIALSKDGNYVAVASGNQLRFYGGGSSTPIWTATAPDGTVESVAISANGDCVVAGGKGTLNSGDIGFWKNAKSLTGTPSPTWTSVDLHGGIYRGCLDL
jgi:WD40 repeat protein